MKRKIKSFNRTVQKLKKYKHLMILKKILWNNKVQDKLKIKVHSILTGKKSFKKKIGN